MVRFRFRDSGEIWEWDGVFSDVPYRMGYWFKRAVQEMKWYRRFFNDCCSLMSICEIYCNDDYCGSIYVSDVLICYHWFIGNNLHQCAVKRSLSIERSV